MVHHNYKNIDRLEERMRSFQNIQYALIGGFVLSLLGALLWALVSVITGYQVGIVAIVMGVIVGVGVRYFGAGFDPIFSIIGGGYALLSCILGAIFSQIGYAMGEEGLGLMQALSFINAETIFVLFYDSFSLMDLVFYGIAVYQGIRLSRRMIEPNTDPNDSLEPPFSSLRGPLIWTISIVLFAGLIYISFQKPAESTYFHDTGEKMSIGAYSAGYEHGEWEYFYKNGQTESKGVFNHGKQVGEWNSYHENGQLSTKVNFIDGLESGPCIAYYEDGTPMRIWVSKNGRLDGKQEYYHENGKLASKGTYKMDKEHGDWVYYYENGQKSSEGTTENGLGVGIWTYWYESGIIKEKLEYENEDKFKIIESYTTSGEPTVKNGTGNYSYFNDDGSVASTGPVKRAV